MKQSRVLFCGWFLLSSGICSAQFGRGDASWATPGADAQRSGWVRSDPKISKDGVQQPEFRFLWKLKLANNDGQIHSLTPAILLTKYIGYRGFRDLALVQSNSDSVYGIDTDLGRIEWNVPVGKSKSAACSSGLMAGMARPIRTAFPAAAGASGAGRGEPAHSGVGESGEGAVTLAAANLRRASAPAPVPPKPALVSPTPQPRSRRSPITIYTLDGQGMVRTLYVSNGLEDEPPVPFVPTNNAAFGFIVVNQIAYVATVDCSGGTGSVRALDLESKQITSWAAKSPIAGASGPAFGPDGTLFATTTGGDMVGLDSNSLIVKDSYTATAGFITSPVVFAYKEKVLAAAATKDGSLHLADTVSLGGTDHSTPLFKTVSGSARFSGGSLASSQDAGGRRWIFAPMHDGIEAWQIREENGALSLVPGWTAAIKDPSAPIIVNGVVFVTSSSSSRAMIYALDGVTGKELWNSGKTITASAHFGSLSAGGSQVYLGTDDGMLWVFGSWIERQ